MNIVEVNPILSQSIPINDKRSYQSDSTSFFSILANQISAVDTQLNTASHNITSFALDENVSAHELMISLEQAKLSLQLAVEVRNRFVEAYQELSRLQI